MAKRYAIIHQGPVTVGPRPTATGTPAGPVASTSPTVKADPVVTVGDLDSTVEPSTLPITIAAYNPDAFNTVLEIHAIQFPPNQAVPGDPLAALALTYPKGSADTSAINGQTISLEIPSMIQTAAGTQDNLVVIAGYDN